MLKWCKKDDLYKREQQSSVCGNVTSSQTRGTKTSLSEEGSGALRRTRLGRALPSAVTAVPWLFPSRVSCADQTLRGQQHKILALAHEVPSARHSESPGKKLKRDLKRKSNLWACGTFLAPASSPLEKPTRTLYNGKSGTQQRLCSVWALHTSENTSTTNTRKCEPPSCSDRLQTQRNPLLLWQGCSIGTQNSSFKLRPAHYWPDKKLWQTSPSYRSLLLPYTIW